MDHIVYLDHRAKELENLISGQKTMIIRGAAGRKLPHGRVDIGDQLFFIRNNGDGQIRAKARVQEVLHSDKLDPETSEALVAKHASQLLLDSRLLKRFAGKRYLVLITTENFEEIEPFKIDRSGYKNMDDWLPVGNISKVILQDGTE